MFSPSDQFNFRHYIAYLHATQPENLCWKVEGAGLKVKGAPAFPPHRDEHDAGRFQCVVALSDHVSFEVWPQSNHMKETKDVIDNDGHFHFSETFKEALRATKKQLIFRASAGDVLIFVGGLTVHGVPQLGDTLPARIVTYASFWPPGTPQGQRHAAKTCRCFQ